MITIAELPENKVEREGIEIAYWVLGEGTPIVLITGLATPAASWHVLPGLLSTSGYKVLVIENRDCGKSSPCEGIDYTIEDMADDVVAVMDEVEIDSAFVFGISMGGMIAQELALNHPSRVRRLMLVATTPGGTQGVSASPAVLTEIVSPVISSDPIESMARMLGKLMGPGFLEQNRELVQRIAKIRVEQGSDAARFSRQWQAIIRFGTWDRLPELKMPTLVIHGASDPLVPFENGKKLASRISTATLIPLGGVGHFVPLEAPMETIKAINDFFPMDEPEPAAETA